MFSNDLRVFSARALLMKLSTPSLWNLHAGALESPESSRRYSSLKKVLCLCVTYCRFFKKKFFIRPPAPLLDLTLIALCTTTTPWHYQGALHFLVAVYLSLFSSDYKFYVSSIVSCQDLSPGKEGRKCWKRSFIRWWWGGGQQGGRRRGGNMYGVGKTLQLDGRNANIESSLSSQDLIQDFSSWTWTLYVL